MDAMIEVIALGVGLIDAIRAEAPAYQGFDVQSFVEATPEDDIDALKGENAQRIGAFTWLQCDADETSFCESAEIRFGVTGPVTDLSLTVRSSRQSGERRTWIESARVRAGLGPVF